MDRRLQANDFLSFATQHNSIAVISSVNVFLTHFTVSNKVFLLFIKLHWEKNCVKITEFWSKLLHCRVILPQDDKSEIFTKIRIIFTLKVWKNTKRLNKNYYT